ncbi:MAG TPA: HEAT repeat domain-containing protein [Thermoanaerobaculia bacterium]|jgi:hypothetical protein
MRLRALFASLLFVAAAGNHAAITIPQNAKWVAWTVPTPSDVTICCSFNNGRSSCCDCTLESDGMSIGDDRRTGSGSMTVAVKLEGGVARKVRVLDGACDVRGKNPSIQWLSDVTPEESIQYLAAQARRDAGDNGSFVTAIALHKSASAEPTLEQLAGRGAPTDTREQALFWLGQRGGDAGFRYLTAFMKTDATMELKKRAVFAMTQTKSEGAIDELISLARNNPSSEIRRESLFWLGQKAGEKAANELRRAVDDDPDDDVREHAVFAISQLPHDRSVPLLIDLVKHHKSAKVRERAMFWLAQTNDPRALQVIEDILTK